MGKESIMATKREDDYGCAPVGTAPHATTRESSLVRRDAVRNIPAWCANNSARPSCWRRPEYVVILRRAYTTQAGKGQLADTMQPPRPLCRGCTEALRWLHGTSARSRFRIADIGFITEW